LATQVDLDGAATHAAADQLLELRLEEVVRLGGPKRHLEVAVVQSTQLEGDVDRVALVMGLAVAGHTQQHANPPLRKEENPKSEIRKAFLVSDFGFSSGALHQDHDEKHPDASDDDGEAREGVAGAAAESTGTANPAEGAGEATALATLNQDHQDEEQPHQQQQNVQYPDEPARERRKAGEES